MKKPIWVQGQLNDMFSFRETAKHSEYGGYGYVGNSRMNKATHDAIMMAYYLAEQPLEFSQGGLNNGVEGASAKTHDGLGVADTRTTAIGISKDEAFRVISFGMDCGVILFARGMGGPDSMVPHLHGVMVGMRSTMHPDTYDQIYANDWGYADGGGGLEGRKSARWWGPPRKPLVTWENSKYNPKNGWKP